LSSSMELCQSWLVWH